ncbi:hypothetical protein MMC26_006285 [Xylographa opegraphella]|nr:hypothetical protein [Xylographa opegraphella]
MPSAGFPTAHSSTSSMFPSSATSGTSIFDAWRARSAKKSTPNSTDTASVRSASTTTGLLSPSEQQPRAQGPPLIDSKPETMTFPYSGHEGVGAHFPQVLAVGAMLARRGDGVGVGGQWL